MTSKTGMNLEKILILCHQPIMQENPFDTTFKNRMVQMIHNAHAK